MKMNVLFRMVMFVMLAFSLVACSEDEELVVIPELDVNYANLNGTWKLIEWNGQVLPEEVYCYIELNRKEHTFTMYQKFDSMYARCITGEFLLEDNDEWGSIISGTYDYGMGEWNNSYIVTELLESGTMIWTVKGDETDISKYERCNKVPDDIKAEAVVISEE